MVPEITPFWYFANLHFAGVMFSAMVYILVWTVSGWKQFVKW